MGDEGGREEGREGWGKMAAEPPRAPRGGGGHGADPKPRG